MNTINTNKLEGIGLLLILFSFAWQLIGDSIINREQAYQNRRIHEKLNSLWDLQIKMIHYSKNNETKSLLNSFEFNELYKNWKYSYVDGLQERNAKFISENNTIKVILFIIGSIIIIITKFIGNKAAPNKVQNVHSR